jgi:Phage integrase, N-terminal SAM-like domain
MPPGHAALASELPDRANLPAPHRRFIEFHGGRTHPKDTGAEEIRAYPPHLAIDGKVAASTQNVAFSALLFLYRDVMRLELPAIDHVERA